MRAQEEFTIRDTSSFCHGYNGPPGGLDYLLSALDHDYAEESVKGHEIYPTPIGLALREYGKGGKE